MTRREQGSLLIGLLALCALLSIWTMVSLRNTRLEIAELQENIYAQEHVMRTEWIDVNGFVREVITTRAPGEDIVVWLNRHESEVTEALMRWPKQ